jgi:hypothetical protein
LVAQLSQAARQTSDSEVEAWCNEQQELVLKSLNRSSIPEVDWLLDLATVHGVDLMHTMWVDYSRLELDFESLHHTVFTRNLNPSSSSPPSGFTSFATLKTTQLQRT